MLVLGSQFSSDGDLLKNEMLVVMYL